MTAELTECVADGVSLQLPSTVQKASLSWATTTAPFRTRTQAPRACGGQTSRTTCGSIRAEAWENTTSAETQTTRLSPGASSGRDPAPSAGPTVTAVRVRWGGDI